MQVSDLDPGSGSSSPHYLTDVDGTLFFSASDRSHGDELWMSDGSGPGTVLIEDLTGESTSADPSEITQVGDRLFLVASNDVFGREIWSGLLGTIQGDFDRNGSLQLSDIDALVSAIATGNDPLPYDLTNDARVNLTDLDRWRELAGAANLGPGRVYRPGDANLDGTVDGSDFAIWDANTFTFAAAWSAGDFNADGRVDGSDFNIWNANKFLSSDARPRSIHAATGTRAPPEWRLRHRIHYANVEREFDDLRTNLL